MRTSNTRLALAAFAIAALLAPAAAPAASTLPPGNSAANQYTESIPTGGGKKDADGANDNNRSPDKVLGAKQADELRAHGPTGKAAAEVAAETAPEVDVVVEPETVAEPAPKGGEGGADGDDSDTAGGVPGTGGGGDRGGEGGGNPQRQGEGGSGQATGTNTEDAVLVSLGEPEGSSGLSAILDEATGSSSGQLGWLLPLLIVAIAAWSLLFAWRQRQQH